jgi:hypothetical protein
MVRIFITFTLPKYTLTSNDQVKEEKMRRAYSRQDRKRNIYRVLVGKSGRKRPIEIPKYGWEYHVETDLKEAKWGSVDWIEQAQDRDNSEFIQCPEISE